jgi:hypothetical protein
MLNYTPVRYFAGVGAADRVRAYLRTR